MTHLWDTFRRLVFLYWELGFFPLWVLRLHVGLRKEEPRLLSRCEPGGVNLLAWRCEQRVSGYQFRIRSLVLFWFLYGAVGFIAPCAKQRVLRHLFSGCLFEQFVNQRLVLFVLARGQTPKPRKKPRMNSYGDQPLGVACFRSADAARALQFRIRGLGNIREINLAVGNMLCVLCGSTAAR